MFQNRSKKSIKIFQPNICSAGFEPEVLRQIRAFLRDEVAVWKVAKQSTALEVNLHRITVGLGLTPMLGSLVLRNPYSVDA